MFICKTRCTKDHAAQHNPGAMGQKGKPRIGGAFCLGCGEAAGSSEARHQGPATSPYRKRDSISCLHAESQCVERGTVQLRNASLAQTPLLGKLNERCELEVVADDDRLQPWR